MTEKTIEAVEVVATQYIPVFSFSSSSMTADKPLAFGDSYELDP